MAQGKREAIPNRKRGNGKAAPDPNIPQPDKASAKQLAAIRDRLTCDDARFWWDFQIKAAASNLLITETTLAAFRDWAEAEAELDRSQREFTRKRLAGEPITNREMVVVPAHEVQIDGKMVMVEEQRKSALGVSALMKNAVERVDRLREKNGFTSLDITKIRTLRQKDMWDDVTPAEQANAIIDGLMEMARNTAMSPATEKQTSEIPEA
jgi:NADH dehydrogenase/NADH:ubiquinone oxidoreductase subunit G